MFIIRFQGGFANQIFQYAFYLQLIEKFSEQNVYADISHYKTCKDHGGFKLCRFAKLKYINIKKIPDLLTINEKNYNQTTFSRELNYYFNGYWQEKRFFPENFSKIKEIFSEKRLVKRNTEIIDSIKQTNSVSVHIRRGDYVNNFMHGNIANQCYLQNSIEYVMEKIDRPHFFVFSDDIVWAKENLNFGDSDVTFITGNSDKVEQDIILMSLCKHNIISNSSFSWWAQFLNFNPEKKVITPEYWFNQQSGASNELIVDNGIKISNTPTVSCVQQAPFFSILIPVYNTSKTLRRTLTSVLNQTFNNIEIIIVDDGSTDDSFEVLKTYQARDLRIKLIKHEKNLGLLATRYTAMKEAKGKYVLFIDSDDWFELNACQVLYEKLQKNPVDMLEFGYINEPVGIKQKICKDYGNRVEALLQRDYLSTFWNKAYGIKIIKEILASVTPFKCTFSEDMFYSLVCACFVKTIGYVDSYLIHHMLFTGISTQKSYTTEQIKNIVNDSLAIEKNLNVFLEKYEKLDFKQYLSRNHKNISFLVNRNRDLKLVFEQLKIVDDAFYTNFFDKKMEHVSNIYFLYNDLFKKSIFQIIINTFKFFIKLFFDRLKVYKQKMLF